MNLKFERENAKSKNKSDKFPADKTIDRVLGSV
jgi:hypothetical protein